MEKTKLTFLQKNWFPIFVWVMGILFAASNIYTASKVSTAELVKRVDAIEAEQASDDEAGAILLPRFYVVEQKVDQILESIKQGTEDRKATDAEIKATQLRVEEKVDKLLLNQR